jgi:hypothetical protein
MILTVTRVAFLCPVLPVSGYLGLSNKFLNEDTKMMGQVRT